MRSYSRNITSYERIFTLRTVPWLLRVAGCVAERIAGLRGDKGYDDRKIRCRLSQAARYTARRAEPQNARRLCDRCTHRRSRWLRRESTHTQRVEEIFGWAKTVGNFRKTRLVGLAKNRLAGFMVAATYNLVRLSKLIPLPEPA